MRTSQQMPVKKAIMVTINPRKVKKQKPACMEVFKLLPANNMPPIELNDFKESTTMVMTRICHQYCSKTAGLTIIPTDTKKTAPKRFLIGVVSLWIISASSVSAKIDPMMKAPKADEKPAILAKTTIKKHKPTAKTVKVSSDMNLRTDFNTDGII